MTEEEAAHAANRLIGLLHQHLGRVQDTSDERVIILNSGQQGYVSGFVVDHFLWSAKITVNFKELPRNKLFQYENKAIIGRMYRPSFVHYYLNHLQSIASQYDLLQYSNNRINTEESPWNWTSNYENSQFDV